MVSTNTEIKNLEEAVHDLSDKTESIKGELNIIYVILVIIGLVILFLFYLKIQEKIKTGNWYQKIIL